MDKIRYLLEESHKKSFLTKFRLYSFDKNKFYYFEEWSWYSVETPEKKLQSISDLILIKNDDFSLVRLDNNFVSDYVSKTVWWERFSGYVWDIVLFEISNHNIPMFWVILDNWIWIFKNANNLFNDIIEDNFDFVQFDYVKKIEAIIWNVFIGFSNYEYLRDFVLRTAFLCNSWDLYQQLIYWDFYSRFDEFKKNRILDIFWWSINPTFDIYLSLFEEFLKQEYSEWRLKTSLEDFSEGKKALMSYFLY